jgi:PadR family transcriptional regulator, regulatory protein PadR
LYIRAVKTGNPLYKGSLTTIILKLLDGQERMYGYEITKKVKDLTAGKLCLTEGALYPALHKLEAEGLLHTSIEMVSNRPRKYYSLTPQGKKENQHKLDELHDFIQQIQQLLQLKPKIN